MLHASGEYSQKDLAFTESQFLVSLESEGYIYPQNSVQECGTVSHHGYRNSGSYNAAVIPESDPKRTGKNMTVNVLASRYSHPKCHEHRVKPLCQV